MKVTNIKNRINNVDSYHQKAKVLYGKLHEDEFEMQMSHYLWDIGIDSPIEQIFFMALRVQCQQMGIEFTTLVEPEFIKPGFHFTLYISPQKKIGNYKVDFHIKLKQGCGESELVVELDGHDFHDKDKRQRSYEKARDRYLLQQGFKVFHFTGSDVVKSPQHVAYEVMQSLGSIYCKGTLEEYDPENTLGWQDA